MINNKFREEMYRATHRRAPGRQPSVQEQARIQDHNKKVIKKIMDTNKKIHDKGAKEVEDKLAQQLNDVMEYFDKKTAINQQDANRKVQDIIDSSR